MHVRGTIENLRGTGLGDDDMKALDVYATAMPAPPSRGGSVSAATANAVARGEVLYRSRLSQPDRRALVRYLETL